MVAKNAGLNNLTRRAECATSEFEAQRETCRENPSDEAGFAKLLKLSTRKNELDEEVSKEMARSFDLARRMSTISAKEANETVLRARALLDQGRMEEAVALLDGASSEIDGLLGDITGIEDLMERKLKALASWIDVEFFRADAILAFAEESFTVRFAKAEGVYKALLAKVGELLEKSRPLVLVRVLRRFAELYDEVGDTLRPIPLLERALGLLRASGDCRLADVAAVSNRLGCLYYHQNRASAARQLYGETSQIYRRLAEADSITFDKHLASALNNIGTFFNLQGEFADSEKAYLESLAIFRRRMASDNPLADESEVAMTLNNLGNLYRVYKRKRESEKAYGESLVIRRRLANGDPDRFGAPLAMTLNNLGNLFHETDRFSESERAYEEALRVFQKLADRNPSRYSEYVARGLNNLGVLYKDQKRIGESERCFLEALKMRRRSILDNPDKFSEGLSDTLTGLAELHAMAGEPEKASLEFLEALAIRERLAEKNPPRFERKLAETLHEQGRLLAQGSDSAKAKEVLARALSIRRRLAEKNPGRFEKDFRETEAVLAACEP